MENQTTVNRPEASWILDSLEYAIETGLLDNGESINPARAWAEQILPKVSRDMHHAVAGVGCNENSPPEDRFTEYITAHINHLMTETAPRTMAQFLTEAALSAASQAGSDLGQAKQWANRAAPQVTQEVAHKVAELTADIRMQAKKTPQDDVAYYEQDANFYQSIWQATVTRFTKLRTFQEQK